VLVQVSFVMKGRLTQFHLSVHLQKHKVRVSTSRQGAVEVDSFCRRYPLLVSAEHVFRFTPILTSLQSTQRFCILQRQLPRLLFVPVEHD
jgi:hypothetical protein